MRKETLIKQEHVDNAFIAAVIGKDNAYVGYTNVNIEQYPYAEDFRKQVDIQIYKAIKAGDLDKILLQES